MASWHDQPSQENQSPERWTPHGIIQSIPNFRLHTFFRNQWKSLKSSDFLYSWKRILLLNGDFVTVDPPYLPVILLHPLKYRRLGPAYYLVNVGWFLKARSLALYCKHTVLPKQQDPATLRPPASWHKTMLTRSRDGVLRNEKRQCANAQPQDTMDIHNTSSIN